MVIPGVSVTLLNPNNLVREPRLDRRSLAPLRITRQTASFGVSADERIPDSSQLVLKARDVRINRRTLMHPDSTRLLSLGQCRLTVMLTYGNDA